MVRSTPRRVADGLDDRERAPRTARPLGIQPGQVSQDGSQLRGDPDQLVPSRVFPGGFDLAGLPPTLSVNASNDRLRASGEAFTRELRSAGVEVRETIVKGTHGFLNAPRSRTFTDGMRELTQWLADHD